MSEKYDALALEGESHVITGENAIREERIAPDGALVASARFSTDRLHRWTLYRRVANDMPILRRVLFIMCNPSTADAFALDPTVGRCVKFARRWQYAELEVVNLFSLRSPYPADVESTPDHLRGADERNDLAIASAVGRADLVIAAWGSMPFTYDRAKAVYGLTRPRPLHHLGLSKDGHPKHPLARGKSAILTTQEPIPWV